MTDFKRTQMDNPGPTEEQCSLVAQMAACSIPADDIALATEDIICSALLHAYFASELATGAIRANARVEFAHRAAFRVQ